jgi:hypothetical protein
MPEFRWRTRAATVSASHPGRQEVHATRFDAPKAEPDWPAEDGPPLPLAFRTLIHGRWPRGTLDEVWISFRIVGSAKRAQDAARRPAEKPRLYW